MIENKIRKTTLDALFYGLILFVGCACVWALIQKGLSIFFSLFVTLFLVNIFFYLLEQKFQYNQGWRPKLKQVKNDFTHLLANSLVVKPLAKFTLFTVVTSLIETPKHSLVADLPLPIQVLFFVVASDFFIYWGHRWMHRSDLGWRIHVTHHTPTKMYFLAAIRSHPFNVALTIMLEMIALIAFGASEEVTGLWTAYMAINGLLQHANIDLRPGFLNKILATNESHRVHHGPNWDMSNSNFGNTTMIWDQVFGTYCNPPVRQESVGLSLFDIPETYSAQLALPFNLEKYRLKKPVGRSHHHKNEAPQSLESKRDESKPAPATAPRAQ